MNRETTNILQGFTIEKWQDWIEDILTLEIANPVSKLSDDDVLKDMPAYLLANNIPPKNYEISLCKTFERYYSLKFSEDKINRILDALIVLRSQRTKQLLFDLFVKKLNPKDDLDFKIRMKILQALYRLDLNSQEINEIQELFYLSDISEYKNRPAFFGYYLRFFRLKRGIPIFFEALRYSIKKLERLKIEKALINRHGLVLFEKIEEVDFYHQTSFYSSLYDWVTSFTIEEFHKPLFQTILNRLSVFLGDADVQKKLILVESKEAKYGLAVTFAIFSITESESLKNFTIESWVTALNLYSQKGKLTFIEMILSKHCVFISKNFSCVGKTQELIFVAKDKRLNSSFVTEKIYALMYKTISLAYIPSETNKIKYKEYQDRCNKSLKETIELFLDPIND